MERKLVPGVEEFDVAIIKNVNANLALIQHLYVTFITLTL
jgi:hypothetical protein